MKWVTFEATGGLVVVQPGHVVAIYDEQALSSWPPPPAACMC
jgi:hypothetical protein